MQDKVETPWPRFVRTSEAAQLLDLSPRTLEKHRCDGTGPVYHKLGGRVVYAVADLQAWIEASARHSTSEAAHGPRDIETPAPQGADDVR